MLADVGVTTVYTAGTGAGGLIRQNRYWWASQMRCELQSRWGRAICSCWPGAAAGNHAGQRGKAYVKDRSGDPADAR